MPIRKRALGAGVAAALMLITSVATGHSEAEMTRPADGETLDSTPDAITVEFDEPMRITRVKLYDSDGTEFPVEAESGRDAVTTLEVPLQPLAEGDYEFSWRGLSEDGHTMSGESSFSIEED